MKPTKKEIKDSFIAIDQLLKIVNSSTDSENSIFKNDEKEIYELSSFKYLRFKLATSLGYLFSVVALILTIISICLLKSISHEENRLCFYILLTMAILSAIISIYISPCDTAHDLIKNDETNNDEYKRRRKDAVILCIVAHEFNIKIEYIEEIFHSKKILNMSLDLFIKLFNSVILVLFTCVFNEFKPLEEIYKTISATFDFNTTIEIFMATISMVFYCIFAYLIVYIIITEAVLLHIPFICSNKRVNNALKYYNSHKKDYCFNEYNIVKNYYAIKNCKIVKK